jgi:HD-like signal output (HDOD) protein
MNALLAFVIGGAVVALIAVVLWWRASRHKAVPANPMSAVTGSNRALTATSRSSDTDISMSFNEALRRFAAYALDDSPRDSLSRPLNPDHAPVFQAAQQVLERIEARPEYIPRRPSLLPKLLATVNDSEATFTEMARIIAQDPALTGNLLRIANSPIYRVSNLPVESIERAVTLVGVRGIRSIIAVALLQPVMTSGSGAYSRFPELVWEHTLYSSLAAESHATQIEKAEPFLAQLCGLLYGLSAIVVFRIVRDQFAAQPHLQGDPASFARLLETWVAPTAGRIAVSWELSQRVQYALESQTVAAELQMENSLGRSLRFGRVAASLIVLCRLGRLTEAQARAIIASGEDNRAQVERLWDRLAASLLKTQ